LGEPGWAPDPDPNKAGGASLNLHAPYYGWSVLIHAENPGGWASTPAMSWTSTT